MLRYEQQKKGSAYLAKDDVVVRLETCLSLEGVANGNDLNNPDDTSSSAENPLEATVQEQHLEISELNAELAENAELHLREILKLKAELVENAEQHLEILELKAELAGKAIEIAALKAQLSPTDPSE